MRAAVLENKMTKGLKSCTQRPAPFVWPSMRSEKFVEWHGNSYCGGETFTLSLSDTMPSLGVCLVLIQALFGLTAFTRDWQVYTMVTSVPFVEWSIYILQIYPLNSVWSFRDLRMSISFSTRSMWNTWIWFPVTPKLLYPVKYYAPYNIC